MQIFFPKEEGPETRATILPEVAKKFIDLGIDVVVETQIGSKIFPQMNVSFSLGKFIFRSAWYLNSEADIVCRINKPNKEEIASLKKGSIHISFLDPFNESELVNEFASSQITAISMELVPRITRAQKMDALSSQANLGGYSAVIEASKTLLKSFPMMMTAAGTIPAAKVLVVGVGVAGLQAIATAKRLGARVDAFDTRPIVAGPIKQGLPKITDIGVTEETDQGYAKELTPDQIALQQEGMKKICGQSDVVITTAQVFGRPAPRIVSREMVEAMKPGSVIVDMAVATGGNVEGSIVDEHVVHNGVTIIGMSNLPGSAAINASQMYGNNLFNMIEEYWDSENKTFNFDLTDEILKGCVVTHQGEIVNEMVKGRR